MLRWEIYLIGLVSFIKHLLDVLEDANLLPVRSFEVDFLFITTFHSDAFVAPFSIFPLPIYLFLRDVC